MEQKLMEQLNTMEEMLNTLRELIEANSLKEANQKIDYMLEHNKKRLEGC